MAYDVDGTIKYYEDLLLYQYNDKPKARDTIGLLAGAAVCDLLILNVNDAFDLMTAVGPQLDIIGEYLGFARKVPLTIPQPYFQMDDYFSPVVDPVGFTDYTDHTINENSVFYLYIFQNTSFSILNDEQYRFMLRLKALLNHMTMTMAMINESLLTFFGTSIICVDQTDMSLSYFIADEPSYLLQLAVDLKLLPKPMGVRISGVFDVPDADKIFKMADYSWDDGADVEFADYLTGFNDKVLLDYRNKVA